MSRMSNLKGRRILLGITGGISAYKSAELVREFIKMGAEVSVVMTQSATRFITPLTMESLSRNPVGLEMFSLTEERTISHIDRAKWADLFLVAPATANYLAKAANGVADDLLSTISLAVKCPVVVAPAMNSGMWSHPAVQDNVRILQGRGVTVISPGVGELACGDEGEGRLADLSEIVETASGIFDGLSDLAGINILVTAGPTREPLDPARFFSNRSSGKMGYALAEAAAARGARVTLVSGPVAIPCPVGVDLVCVQTAQQMLTAARDSIEKCGWLIMAAAVADFSPVNVQTGKIKKEASGVTTVEMKLNPDILMEIAPLKGDRLFVGFAAESENIEENAAGKLMAKGLDLIVANDITAEDAGFESDDNRAVLIGEDGVIERFPLMTKRELAERILDHSVSLWLAKENG